MQASQRKRWGAWLIGGLMAVLVATGCSSDSGQGPSEISASQQPGTASPEVTASAAPTAATSVTPTIPGATVTEVPVEGGAVRYVVTGKVLIYGEPVVSARVFLHSAPPDQRSTPPLGATTTDGAGQFALQAQVGERDNVYLLTGGGLTQMRPGELSPVVVLGTLLGQGRPPTVVINELTTVAGAFAASEYFVGESLSGSTQDLAESALTAADLVDPVTGVPAAQAAADVGQLTMLNTLGNALSSCAWNEPRCAAIVAPVGREPATTTWSGMAATARDPGEVGPIFAIQQGYTAFSPTFQEEPPSGGWVLLP